MVSEALDLPDSLPGDGDSGCSASLYSLYLRPGPPLPFLFPAALSFPLLTELVAHPPMFEEELEVLLSGCPQLLVLSCTVWQSWQAAVTTAARCCPLLLDLTVTVDFKDEKARDDVAAAPEPDIRGRFLPDLLALSLCERGEHRPPCDFSVLRHFTSPPHPELRFVSMQGLGLTAEDVLSLACLPQLCYLHASRQPGQSHIAEVDEARSRAGQLLLSRDAADQADSANFSPSARANCGDDESNPPLGPHQQQEMRQRVLSEVAKLYRSGNCLAAAEGVDWRRARAAFFAELQTCSQQAQQVRSAESSTGGRQ